MRAQSLRLWALAGLALVATAAAERICSRNGAETRPSEVRVFADRPGRVIPKEIFGSNLQWEHDGDRILDAQGENARFMPGVLEAIAEAGITVLRFPGGSLSNTYEWRSGIGERRARPAGLNFARQKEPSRFGTDELIRLCREAGLEALLTVNPSISPGDAADWVEYVNGSQTTGWGRRRATNGFSEPLGVKYWEIGNEVYNPKEPGHSTAAEYGRKLLAFAKAMKTRDPSIKVGASLEVTFLQAAWMGGIFPHMVTWNEEVLKVAGPSVDFASVHFYAPFDRPLLGGETEIRRLAWAGPTLFAENLGMLRAPLRKYARPDTEIAVTEYSIFFDPKQGRLDERMASTETAIFVAMMLFEMMRDPEIRLANHWSLLNNSVFGILRTERTGGLEKRPTFEVFRAMKRFAGARVLPVEVSGAAYSTGPKGSVPKMESLLSLQAAAARREDRAILLAIVNRSPDDAVAARIAFQGRGPPARLAGAMYIPVETGIAERFRRVGVTLTPGRDGGLDHIFAPHSFTVLEAAGGGEGAESVTPRGRNETRPTETPRAGRERQTGGRVE